MKAANLPPWLHNVPLKTVGVLAAAHIFGRNIANRHNILSGQTYLHNAVENVVNYVLNPILPNLNISPDDPASFGPAQAMALRNIRDCFNYIFHIQVEYFKILHRLRPERFRSPKTGNEFNLNQFRAKGPTLLNSEKRYLILSRLDGTQPFDLDLNWDADFNWVEDKNRRLFRNRLLLAQDAYTTTLRLGDWYMSRERSLVIPVRTIAENLIPYFDYLGNAAYLMARQEKNRTADWEQVISQNLVSSCLRLEQFTVDLQRTNLYTIARYDLGKLGGGSLDAVVKVRAEDRIGHLGFKRRYEKYTRVLSRLYRTLEFEPPPETVEALP